MKNDNKDMQGNLKGGQEEWIYSDEDFEKVFIGFRYIDFENKMTKPMWNEEE